ncbi:uncharacterized protein LOC111709200 [Eurytemora carolleeae]|uniref:uncharacterized protein LOC111709200 n=1 Tax=Eurytemora carolleeae TaxID=1294199 RepID=UPI000C768402|nr:uncharacterized protein LOC111709200 [Eurytemora carolleeae]|eukprot:XP_023338580.1 uncharacterized protein LOC111709200 [Eurytemora affinis]
MSRGFPVKPRTRSKKRYKPETNSYSQIQFTGHRTSNTAVQIMRIPCLSVILLCTLASAKGWRDGDPSKWAPRYLTYRPIYPSYGPTMEGIGRQKMSEFGGKSAKGFFGTMGSVFKRERFPRQPEACVPEGGICLYRGGMRGASVKLNCCEDTTCWFVGKSFNCVADSVFEEEEAKEILEY